MVCVPSRVSTRRSGGFSEPNPELLESNWLWQEISWRFFPECRPATPQSGLAPPDASAWDLNQTRVQKGLTWSSQAGSFKFKERGFSFSELASSNDALPPPDRQHNHPDGMLTCHRHPPRGTRNLCPRPPPKSKETPLGKQGVTAGGAKRLLYWKRALKPSLPTRRSISARVLSKGVRLLGTLGKA